MERVEEVYTLAEIAMATGINQGTLASRRKRLGIQADRGGYTLEQAKQLVKKPPRKRKANPRTAERLRAKLKNDGYL